MINRTHFVYNLGNSSWSWRQAIIKFSHKDCLTFATPVITCQRVRTKSRFEPVEGKVALMSNPDIRVIEDALRAFWQILNMSVGVQLKLSMKLEIPYGKDGSQPLVVPQRNFAAAILPNDVYSGFEYEADAIQQGIDAPIQSDHLEQFLEGAENVVVIVNDGTRPTPTARVLDVLQTKMRLDSARYLIATGAHRAPTEEELSNIFGDHLPKVRAMVHSHDSRKDKMVLLGQSKNGTEMWVNEIAVKADRLIIITSVEPHYFAGYTGGGNRSCPASHHTRPSSRTTNGHEAGGPGSWRCRAIRCTRT